MTKLSKIMLGAAGLFLSLFVVTGCTKSFCSVNDKACLIANYEEKNKEEIDKKASENGYLLPGDQFWNFVDTKVDLAYANAIAFNTGEDVPQSYVEGHLKFLNPATSEEEKKHLPNTETIRAIIKFAGNDASGNQAIFANLDKWVEEANKDALVKDYAPTEAYINYYKTSLNSGVGNAVTCLTPESGYYGTGSNIYVEGKTWGQAFTEYGPIEGLLVYPIGYLLHVFSNTFGLSGWGQIAAILLTTIIVRAVIIAMSFKTTTSQSRMSAIQPQLSMLQAKYPNAQTNQYERQKLAQEQMALYKANGIHPFRQILILFVQFPIFIAVWGAMQGSAILTQGSLFGLQLSTVTSAAILAGNEETLFAIVLFVMMAISQFFSTMIPQWFQKYRRDKAVGAKTVKIQEDKSQQNMMKWMPIIMMVMIIFMGLQLPAAMAIYWFFGALISIVQTVLTEIYQSSHKNKKPKDKITKVKKVKNKAMKLRR